MSEGFLCFLNMPSIFRVSPSPFLFLNHVYAPEFQPGGLSGAGCIPKETGFPESAAPAARSLLHGPSSHAASQHCQGRPSLLAALRKAKRATAQPFIEAYLLFR